MKQETLLKMGAILSVFTSLSGCSPYSKNFDCPYGEGVGCASLSKVNKMLDARMIETEEALPSTSEVPNKKKKVTLYFGPSRPMQMLPLGHVTVI